MKNNLESIHHFAHEGLYELSQGNVEGAKKHFTEIYNIAESEIGRTPIYYRGQYVYVVMLAHNIDSLERLIGTVKNIRNTKESFFYDIEVEQDNGELAMLGNIREGFIRPKE